MRRRFLPSWGRVDFFICVNAFAGGMMMQKYQKLLALALVGTGVYMAGVLAAGR